jgi:hypothetical protein
MNNEVKFRAKRKYNDEWVCGYLVQTERSVNGKQYPYIVRPFAGNPCNRKLEVIPETVERFTGFEDKKGNEIYFGNIVRQKLEDFMCKKGWFWWYAEVKEVNGCAVLLQLSFDYSGCKFPDDFTFLYEEAANVEVVSDINDNPKLKKRCKKYKNS